MVRATINEFRSPADAYLAFLPRSARRRRDTSLQSTKARVNGRGPCRPRESHAERALSRVFATNSRRLHHSSHKKLPHPLFTLYQEGHNKQQLLKHKTLYLLSHIKNQTKQTIARPFLPTFSFTALYF